MPNFIAFSSLRRGAKLPVRNRRSEPICCRLSDPLDRRAAWRGLPPDGARTQGRWGATGRPLAGPGGPATQARKWAARPPPAKAGLARAAEAPAAAISTPLPQGPFYWALT